MARSIRLALVVLSLAALVGTAAVLGGCAKSTAEGTSGTAPTPTLELTTPTSGGTVAAGDVSISVKTTGLKFTMPSNTVVPGEGHVHFTLDDEPFKMSTSPDYVYEGVAAGEHTLTAELVQNDTKPLSPPVKQEITFIAE